MSTDISRVPTRYLPPGYERATCAHWHKRQLYTHLAKMELRGEIQVVGRKHDLSTGMVTATYRRIKPTPIHRRPRPRWVRPALVIAVPTGVALGLGYGAYRAVMGVAGAVSDPSATFVGMLAIVALLLLGAALTRRTGGGRTIEGTFRGTIK